MKIFNLKFFQVNRMHTSIANLYTVGNSESIFIIAMRNLWQVRLYFDRKGDLSDESKRVLLLNLLRNILMYVRTFGLFCFLFHIDNKLFLV